MTVSVVGMPVIMLLLFVDVFGGAMSAIGERSVDAEGVPRSRARGIAPPRLHEGPAGANAAESADSASSHCAYVTPVTGRQICFTPVQLVAPGCRRGRRLAELAHTIPNCDNAHDSQIAQAAESLELQGDSSFLAPPGRFGRFRIAGPDP